MYRIFRRTWRRLGERRRAGRGGHGKRSPAVLNPRFGFSSVGCWVWLVKWTSLSVTQQGVSTALLRNEERVIGKEYNKMGSGKGKKNEKKTRLNVEVMSIAMRHAVGLTGRRQQMRAGSKIPDPCSCYGPSGRWTGLMPALPVPRYVLPSFC